MAHTTYRVPGGEPWKCDVCGDGATKSHQFSQGQEPLRLCERHYKYLVTDYEHRLKREVRK